MGPLNSQLPPSVLTDFAVIPSLNFTSFNCTLFVELKRMGCLLNDTLWFNCRDSKSSTSGLFLLIYQLPRPCECSARDLDLGAVSESPPTQGQQSVVPYID
ncbi:hypothetical protein PEX1_106380 [Penicillium expansum]|uniref:Uncharacterized protein n=1 Tax=Penicillium expansum TaxID=27334 RepID=A0A0A2I638_PENEN|nr:hypothetical protein PEX2_048580 [Penicillium expansum]KGO38569.1 hypothetical protein PEX1_106380 [Penicillium expansum]KGO43981.1 hypothetical protein PEXP_054650 [Penicillium expansum]KGO52470.1 hypothetical protein PEX2_048580 [Penicillium expansum]